MADEYDKERDELLNRFANALRADSHDNTFFDEDDLIDIFDYAGDIGNDFLRAEALMMGARFYPHSEPLKQRRALFYTDVLDPGAISGLAESLKGQDSMLAEVSRINTRQPRVLDINTDVEHLLNDFPLFDDEETIRFVRLLSDFGKLDWLYDNFERVKNHCENDEILYYEVGFEFTERNSSPSDNDKAAELLQVLVDSRPFVSDYWSLLAHAQFFSSDHKDRFEESIEYALALDPQNSDAIALKINALATSENPREHIRELLDIFDMNPAYEQALRVAFSLLETDDERRNNLSRLIRLFKHNPASEFAITYILALDPKKGAALLPTFEKKRFYADNNANSSDTVLASIIYNVAPLNHEGAGAVINYLGLKIKNSSYVPSEALLHSILETLFYVQDFRGVVELSKYTASVYGSNGNIIAISAISYAKLREYDSALELINFYLNERPNPGVSIPGWCFLNRFACIGIRVILTELRDALMPRSDGRRRRFSAKSYDPYGLWSEANEHFTPLF